MYILKTNNGEYITILLIIVLKVYCYVAYGKQSKEGVNVAKANKTQESLDYTIKCSVCGKAEYSMYQCSSCGAYFCADCVIRGSNGSMYCPNCAQRCNSEEQQYDENNQPTIVCSICGDTDENMYQCSNCGSYFCHGCVVIGSNGNAYCPNCSATCNSVVQN